MLRFNSATLTANMQEKVRILVENGQVPLAYMTAKAHGIEEFTKTLENTIIESEEYDHEKIFAETEKFIGQHNSRSKALLPLRPIFTGNESLQHSNWPMINLRAKEAERAAQMFMKQKQDLENNEDMFFDAKEYSISNKSVANILQSDTSTQKNSETEQSEKKPEVVAEATLDNLDDAQWGDGDELEIDMAEDLGMVDAEEQKTGDPLIDGVDGDDQLDSDIFVPPAAGPDPIQ